MLLENIVNFSFLNILKRQQILYWTRRNFKNHFTTHCF